jgi:bifunctional oligoribonuclease and PAP phosphatase NrnA
VTGVSVPPEAVDFIRAHGRFLVLGHREPDGDCVASQLALCGLLSALGKQCVPISVGPFDRPEIEPFAPKFLAAVPGQAQDGVAAGAAADLSGAQAARGAPAAGGTGVIIVDCSTADRTGLPAGAISGIPCLVVDHHSSGEVFGDVRFIRTTEPSTTVLILALYDAFGIAAGAEQARLILFGLCTDTGFFRHLAEGAKETFRTIARLVECGTSTAEVFQMVYGKRNLASRKLLALMLQRVESHWQDWLLLTWQTRADRLSADGYHRGEDDLYRLLQTVKGNRVVVLIKEEREGLFSLGLRSNADIDVGAVARSFGGGGHRQAAGCDVRGSLESVRQAVLDAMEPLLRV